MPPQTLLSGTLRRVTVAVSLLTSALFAALAGVFVAGPAAIPAGEFATPTVVAAVAYLPLFWAHCYAAGFVAYPPTAFGFRRAVETLPARVSSCAVCGGRDDEGVCRRYGEQFVVAGVPLATTEGGENWYCGDCHAVEHGDGGSAAAVERALESERN